MFGARASRSDDECVMGCVDGACVLGLYYYCPGLLLLLAVDVVQEAVFGQPLVVVAVNVDGGMLLGALVVTRVGEPGEQ